MNNISVDVINIIIDKYKEYHYVNLRETRRDRHLVLPRQCLFYVLRKEYNMTYQRIGDIFGMNHASVIHGYRLISDMLEIGDRETEDIMSRIIDLFRLYSLDITKYICAKNEALDNFTKMVKSLRAIDVITKEEVVRIVDNVFRTEPSKVA